MKLPLPKPPAEIWLYRTVVLSETIKVSVGSRKNLGVMPVYKGLFFHCRHDGGRAFFVSLASEENNCGMRSAAA
jgi:hypothetical protein